MSNTETRFPSLLGCKTNKRPREGELKITSLGVTSVLLDDGNTKLLLDGMVTRPSLIRVFMGSLNSEESLVQQYVRQLSMQGLSAIFVSHSHYDHVLDVPNFSKLTGAKIYGSASTLNVARGSDVPEDCLQEFRAGDSFRVGDFSVEVFPALHSEAKFLKDRPGTKIEGPLRMPCRRKYFTEGGSFDFLITHHDTKLLFHPSCNFIPGLYEGMHADVLFMSVARMQKMDALRREEHYRQMLEMLAPGLVIPVHWDHFFLPVSQGRFTLPAYMDNVTAAIEELIGRTADRHIELKILPADTSLILTTKHIQV